MNRRRLIFSITLGLTLTVGLLVAFSQSRSSAMTQVDTPRVDNQFNTLAAPRAQDTVSTAHVVVVFSGEKAAVRPVSWTEPISRVGALRVAGFSVETSGGAICNIDGDGCPASNCFCADNWWWQGVWNTEAESWDAPWPLPDPAHGDVLGFRNNTAWGPPALPARAYTASLKALSWLRGQQQPNGSFGSANYTAEVLMAVSANSLDASTWRSSPSLLASVLSNGEEFANRNSAGAGKLAVALAAQESCWPIGAKKPLSHYDPTSGTFSTDTLYQAWGILGTAAVSDTVPISAVESLKENQQPNGGWELFAGFGADTNSTALAIEALISAGEPVTSTSIVSGLNYLENAQNADGGFPYSPDSPYGTDSDTNSTAYVIQALFAAGEDPLSGQWAISETNPISYLLSMQLPNGSFEWQDGYGADQIATQQAIPALLHRSFPMMVDDLESCYGISGQVVGGIEGAETGLKDVAVEAEGADDLFSGSTDATGTYTLSVPSSGPYTLKPSKEGFTFSPTLRTTEVGGAPGEVSHIPQFKGETRVYLPLIIRY